MTGNREARMFGVAGGLCVFNSKESRERAKRDVLERMEDLMVRGWVGEEIQAGLYRHPSFSPGSNNTSQGKTIRSTTRC